jgi:hypothetical protein
MVERGLLALQVLVRNSAVGDRVKRLVLFYSIRMRINLTCFINENALLQEVIMKSLGGLEELFIMHESSNGWPESMLDVLSIFPSMMCFLRV